MDIIQKRIIQERFNNPEALEDYKMQRKLERMLQPDGSVLALETDLFSWFRKQLIKDGHHMGIRDSIDLYKCMRGKA